MTRAITEQLHILSLGAGVQSTMLALLSHLQTVPEYVPRFDAAIFADTQEEPAEVYRHLEWLTKEVASSFPILVRTAGKLGNDLLTGNRPEGTGVSYDMPGRARFASIPAFTSDVEGEPQGIVRRQCSKEYKTEVIDKVIRREILGLAKGQRVPKGTHVNYYIGLSAEEGKRIHGRNGKPGVKARIESAPWAKAHFPLSDMFLNREQIKAWLSGRVPHETPRSACSFCPFHSDAEWIHIRDNDSQAWARSIEIDRALRGSAFMVEGLDQKLYLHHSCLPLEDVVLKVPEPGSHDQQEINFSVLECEGMCGV